MKYGVVSKAYKSLTKINDKNLSLKTAYSFYRLKEEFRPHFEFEREKITEVFKNHNIELGESGEFTIADPEKARLFAKDYNDTMKEIYDLDVDVHTEKIKIKLSEDLQISMEDIEALEPFVEFVE